MKITTVGIDLAKTLFQVRGVNEHGKAVLKKQLKRCRGLKKNTTQLTTLFALSNLWMARRSLLGAQG